MFSLDFEEHTAAAYIDYIESLRKITAFGDVDEEQCRVSQDGYYILVAAESFADIHSLLVMVFYWDTDLIA